ncbi:MAG: glutamate--tRNA ligase [Bacteroidota bacterium]
MKTIRVRFAPSPTGPLHMGGVRTALFNYLFAKKHKGTFILRIEDTDQARYVPGAEEYIMESLEWCGIQPDEGIRQGGSYGPYRQSDRKELYEEKARVLVENNWAYYAFDTPEELEAMRERLKEQKSSVQQYGPLTRGEMRNSLTLTKEETEKLMEQGVPYVIRFKMPEDELVHTHDIVRGEVKVNTAQLDDKILFKSDGMPTYHLANVVDDYAMEISHVIRGEEWLPSLPLHVMLYRAFGWEDQMPEFAHLPLLLKPSGKGKLSKRDGDQLGFPVFPLQWKDPQTGDIANGYREDGYFADAFVNMLALLGWNPGTEQELLSLDELIASFDLTKVQKAGAKFDPEKAKWFNHQYLVTKPEEELVDGFQKLLKEKNIDADRDYVAKIVAMVKERCTFISDIWEQAFFFFEAPQVYDAKVVKKRWKEATPGIISELKEQFEKVEEWSAEALHDAVQEFIDAREVGMGQVMNPLRLTLVGAGKGPGVTEIAELLGKEETLKRMEAGIQNIER